MKKVILLALSIFSWPALAETKLISCEAHTGLRVCHTQKNLSVETIPGQTASIMVSVQNRYGCEPPYQSKTAMDQQSDGTWRSANGKRHLSMSASEVRFDDQDLTYDYNGDIGGLSPFYFPRSKCR